MQGRGEINGIQASILRQLFRRDGLRFAEINVDGVPSDQFSYHLRQLAKRGLIEKSADATYRLSAMGKTRTIMLYPNKDGFIEQGFLAVRIVLSKVENGQTYFLMEERALVPYKGTYATPGDKIFFGEDVLEAAQRAMKTETGLTCDMQLRGILHLKDNYRGDIVQDKYFFVCAASNPRGTFKPSDLAGPMCWMTYDELKASGKSIQYGLEILDVAQKGGLVFDEQTLHIDSY